MKVKQTIVFSSFVCILMLTAQSSSSTYVRQEQRYALTCMSQGVDCVHVWKEECCQPSVQQMGRSFKSMANWRFGSMFRNSIPPPRAYSPPSFDQIFGEPAEESRAAAETRGDGRELAGESSTETTGGRVNLKLHSKRPKASVKNQDARKKYITKLNLRKLQQLQQLFKKKEHAKSTTPKTTTTAAPTTTPYTLHLERLNLEKIAKIKLMQKLLAASTTNSPKTHRTAKTTTAKAVIETTTRPYRGKENLPAVQDQSKYMTKFETTTLNEIPQLSQRKKSVPKLDPNLYASSVGYGLPNRGYQTKHEETTPATTTTNAAVTSFNGLNFIDMSQHTRIGTRDRDQSVKSSSNDAEDVSDEPDRLVISRLDDFSAENDVENMLENDPTASQQKYTEFSQELCEVLRVPCRFVTEHPCCKMPQLIDMVARPRAMDGSADLRWRFMQSGLTKRRQGPQGRMISGFSGSRNTAATSFTTDVQDNSLIQYNYATSKDVVSVPEYHYDGGPQQTTTILSQCWRLTYLRCSRDSEHPCCSLAVPSQSTRDSSILSSNLLDKWLVRL